MPVSHLLLVFLSSVVAGAINSVAGGGTLLTFPTLTEFIGLPSKIANATNTMALWPASLAGVWGFRQTHPPSRKVIVSFVITSALGGIVGAALLRQTSEGQFKLIVPWLILMAAVLFLFQGHIAKRLGFAQASDDGPVETPPWSSSTWMIALFFQFLVGIYGGYFGAGIGIIMLAALGCMRMGDIYQMNFLKNFGALAVNFTAAVLLGVWGMVNWPIAAIMCGGSLLGGFCGSGIAKKLGAQNLRTAISIYGFLIAGYMFFKQFV